MNRTMLAANAVLICGALVGTTASAATLTPSTVRVSTPGGSDDTSNPFTDDILLDSLVFGSTTYAAKAGSFRSAERLEVLGGRDQINAEWGDDDDDSDGDDTPFAKAGFPNAGQETTDPTIQDATLLNAFNSLSLSEITDGEGQAESSFKISFTQSLAFNDVGGDFLPDILFFERGGNDVFTVELITGGTFADPIYSKGLAIDSRDFGRAGFSINTLEIDGSQDMHVGGFDLAAFGLGTGDSAFGFRLTTTDGPDLGGFFLAAEDSASFGAPLSAIPLPASVWLMLSTLGAAFGLLRRGRARHTARA